MPLLKLIAVNFKGVLRDKGYLVMAFVVLPILFPLFMFLLISQISAQKVTSANKESVISKSGDVIGVYSSDNRSTNELKQLLLSQYGHRNLEASSDNEAIEMVKSLDASYGMKIVEADSGQVNVTLWVDSKRNSGMTLFIRELEEAIETFTVINRRNIGKNNGISVDVINNLQNPVYTEKINVNKGSAKVINFIVLFMMYLCVYGPIMSSNRYSFYSIVSEHEKHWSYIPLLGKMSISTWVGSKVALAIILSALLSVFGLLVFKGVFALIAGMEDILLESGFHTLVGKDSLLFVTGLNEQLSMESYFIIWLVGFLGLVQFTCITATIASLFNNQKTASFADSAIGTVLLIVILNMNPEVAPSAWSYIVFPFSTGQLMSDVVNGVFSWSSLGLYFGGSAIVTMLSLNVAGRTYRRQIGRHSVST